MSELRLLGSDCRGCGNDIGLVWVFDGRRVVRCSWCEAFQRMESPVCEPQGVAA